MRKAGNRMEQRRSTRYNIAGIVRGSYSLSDIALDIQLDSPVRCSIIDMSLAGIGFAIHGIPEDRAVSISQQETLFITLISGDDRIIAETRLAWNAIQRTGDTAIMKGGLEFSIISPENRKKLAAMIERIRNSIV